MCQPKLLISRLRNSKYFTNSNLGFMENISREIVTLINFTSFRQWGKDKKVKLTKSYQQVIVKNFVNA